MEKVTFLTNDGVRIVGSYYAQDKPSAPAVVLLHMMPALKESWREFAELLAEKGFQVLAIDERGHGESISTEDGKTLDYKEFSDIEQQDKILDLYAAVDFLNEKGVSMEDVYVGGASIGANLTLQYLANTPSAKAGFALSPGYNYKGIEAKPLMENLREYQHVFLAASEDDPNVPDSYDATKEISEIGSANVSAEFFDVGGHGTDMFEEHPDFMERLAEWLHEQSE